MPGAYYFSKEQEDEMLELHKKGVPLLDIGKKFNIGYKPVQRILVKKYGVSFDKPCCKVGDVVNGWEIIKIEMRYNFQRNCGRNDSVATARSVVEGYDIEKDFLLSKFNSGSVIPPDNNKDLIPHNKSHGESKSRMYKIWSGIINRCRQNHQERFDGTSYQKYKVEHCKEWAEYENFRDWALKNGYSDDLSIDRIDTTGNYESTNCRWADRKTQTRNKTNNNHIPLTAFGETKSLCDWIDDERCSITNQCLRYRIKQGWDNERAISEPSGSPFRVKETRSKWLELNYKIIYDLYDNDYWFEKNKTTYSFENGEHVFRIKSV